MYRREFTSKPIVRKQALKAVGPTFRLPPVDACAMSSETSLVIRTNS